MSAPGRVRVHVVAAASAADRLDAAAACLRDHPPGRPLTVVAATRGAADELVREMARARPATFGIGRYSLTQLAARLAATRLAGRGIAPATSLGVEAVAARAAFDAAGSGALAHLQVVAAAPGFPRALARTMTDLHLAEVPIEALAAANGTARDLAPLIRAAEQELVRSGSADRARLLAAAAEAIADEPMMRAPLLLLDVAVESAAEERFVEALIAASVGTCATVPIHDSTARALFARVGASEDVREEEPRGSDLQHLRAFLFAEAAPPARPLDGSLEFFSAPGEGRECVEIARRMLAEARRGVRFDEMAVFVRSPERYQGLLEHAFARAGIPAWFDRGTRRPHPAGRAFLALLACADEGLSARRFAEYLSLGQIPPEGQSGDSWVAAGDEVLRPAATADAREEGETEDVDTAGVSPDGHAIAGTLRTPRRWERLLVEAAVIGGSPARWERRLDGLAAELEARLDSVRRDDPGSGLAIVVERDAAFLRHLRKFALPIVRELAAWSPEATWGDWLERLHALVPRTVRAPALLLRILADLRPMADVGPVTLGEVRRVLADRLRIVQDDPPARRYGRVLVGAPALARGRSFRVVFVPGLAERMFPRKPAQDPLLLDEVRGRLAAALDTRPAQARQERLLLHLVTGAARDRLYVSYPRLDVAEARPRVPSFYALDVLRGATGRVPEHDTLAQAAARAGDRTLAWPAPAQPSDAIDDQEHDLAILRRLLDAPDPAAVRGHAQYILRLNPALRRSVVGRWARHAPRWSPHDGLIRVSDGTREALERHRLSRRPYSVSALQRYATCPYQFLLSAIHRLAPADQPAPLQRLDPLTRGIIVHRVQMLVLRALDAQAALPVTPASLATAMLVLDEVLGRTADEYRERLAPAIDRVWREEMAAIGRDLRGWLRHMAEAGGDWIPRSFELGFGLPPSDARDPRSQREPVTLDGRFVLRGSVDLVEEHQTSGALRVTDHKTGKDRARDGLVIGGGTMLQPVVYSLAVEQVTGRPVAESRLFFCTAAAGYAVRPVPVTETTRRAGLEALEIIDRAVEQGALPAAPAPGACTYCDFRPVCGPDEVQRTARKPGDRLRDLLELRSRR